MKSLDIISIKSEIKKRHQKFWIDFGSLADKVNADHNLMTEIVYAHILQIVKCLKEENVINNCEELPNGPIQKLLLSRKGWNSYITVSTNGLQIMLQGFTHVNNIMTSDIPAIKEVFANVNSNEFDWVDFSMKLLDFIHVNIYDRKAACDYKITASLMSNRKSKGKNA